MAHVTSKILVRRESPSVRWASRAAALIYVAAGLAHVLGVSFVAERYEAWGYPDALMTLVGVLELLGGLGLLSPQIASISAMLLGTVMLGAVYTHLFRGNPVFTVVPAVMLGVLIFIGKRQLERPFVGQSSHEVPPGAV